MAQKHGDELMGDNCEYIRAFTGTESGSDCTQHALESLATLYDKFLRVFFNIQCDCECNYN